MLQQTVEKHLDIFVKLELAEDHETIFHQRRGVS